MGNTGFRTTTHLHVTYGEGLIQWQAGKVTDGSLAKNHSNPPILFATPEDSNGVLDELHYYHGDNVAGSFDGDKVDLRVIYQPDNNSSGVVIAHGTAPVVPGVTTFPHVASLSTGNFPGIRVIDTSVAFSGSHILIKYPASEEGTQIATGPFNGYVFENGLNDSPITGASLANTNIPGLTASNLAYTAHSIKVNEAGLTLPTNAPAVIDLSATFGPTTANPTPSTGAAPSHGQAMGGGGGFGFPMSSNDAPGPTTPSDLIRCLAGKIDLAKDLIPRWVETVRSADAGGWGAAMEQASAGFAMPGYYDTDHTGIPMSQFT